MTVSDMQNPKLMQRCTEAIFSVHHLSGVAEAIHAIKPLDPTSLYIDSIINEWGRDVHLKVFSIRSKLDI